MRVVRRALLPPPPLLRCRVLHLCSPQGGLEALLLDEHRLAQALEAPARQTLVVHLTEGVVAGQAVVEPEQALGFLVLREGHVPPKKLVVAAQRHPRQRPQPRVECGEARADQARSGEKKRPASDRGGVKAGLTRLPS